MRSDSCVKALENVSTGLCRLSQHLWQVVGMQTVLQLDQDDLTGIPQCGHSHSGCEVGFLPIAQIDEAFGVDESAGRRRDECLHRDSGIAQRQGRCIHTRSEQGTVILNHLAEDVDLRAGKGVDHDRGFEGLLQQTSEFVRLPVASRSVFPLQTRKCRDTVLTVDNTSVLQLFGAFRFVRAVNRAQDFRIALLDVGGAFGLGVDTQTTVDVANLMWEAAVDTVAVLRNYRHHFGNILLYFIAAEQSVSAVVVADF